MSVLRTPICERFGIQYPIFGFAHDIATCAAITNAGGLGGYGATRRFPHEIGAHRPHAARAGLQAAPSDFGRHRRHPLRALVAEAERAIGRA